MAPFLILLLLIGGGASLAAKSALPGGALYSVKVGFNEPLGGAFAIGDAAKAQWDATLEKRRLTEAETVATQGTLDAPTAADLTARFNAAAQDFGLRVNTIQSSGRGSAAAVSAASVLAGALDGHVQIMGQLAATANGAQLPALGDAASAASSDVSQDISVLESAYLLDPTAATQASAQASQAAAQASIDLANTSTTSLAANAGPDAMASVTATIDLASQAYDKGTAASAAGDYGNAFIQFQQALRIGTQVSTLLGTGKNLGIAADGAAVTPVP